MSSVQDFPVLNANPCSLRAPHPLQNIHQYSVRALRFTAATFKTSHQRLYNLQMAEANYSLTEFFLEEEDWNFFPPQQMDNHNVMLGSGDHQRL